MDQVLAEPGAAEPPNEVLETVGHGGERYSNDRTYAHAWRSPLGRHAAEHGDVQRQPHGGSGDRADDESRQPERGELRHHPQTTRGERHAASRRHRRAERREQHGEHERRRDAEPDGTPASPNAVAPGPLDEHVHEQRADREQRAASARVRARRRADTRP